LLPLASPPEVDQNRSWSGCPSASRILADALDLNGVGDFGELLWYTVLNVVEHLGAPASTRSHRPDGPHRHSPY
jgi:hypothetical protein